MKNFKRVLILALCLSMLLNTITFAAGSTSLTPADGVNQTLSPNHISINVKDADVRDVLSAVAVNMGYSIIYKGDVRTISVKIDNLAPGAAFDYLLKILDMACLQDGSTLIVGTKDTLTQDFKGTLSLTSFKLTYITADVITAQLSALAIPVTVLALDSNPSMLWVQGFPADVAKVGELVHIMDIMENENAAVVDEASLDTGKKQVARIALKYITPEAFNKFLKSIGIDCGVALTDYDDSLWVYATTEERRTILSIRSNIDRSNVDFDDLDGEGTAFRVLNAGTVSKKTVTSAIAAIAPKLQIITVGNKTQTFLVVGLSDDIRRAASLVTELGKTLTDTAALTSTFFSQDLASISVLEAQNRLQSVVFGDTVGFYGTPYPEFSKTIFFYCSSDYEAVVRDLLTKIDKNASDVRIPVYRSKDAATLTARKDLIITLLDGATIDFQIGKMGAVNVLYAKCSPEVAKQVEDMVAKLDSAPTDDIDATDITIEKYVAAGNPDPRVAPITEGKWAAYGAWVERQLRGAGNPTTPPAITTRSMARSVMSPAEQLLAETSSDLRAHLRVSNPITVTDRASAEEAKTWMVAEAKDFLARNSYDVRVKSASSKELDTAYPYSLILPQGELDGKFTLTIPLVTEDVQENCNIDITLPASLLSRASVALGARKYALKSEVTDLIVDEDSAKKLAEGQIVADANESLHNATSGIYKDVKVVYVSHDFLPATEELAGHLQVEITLQKDAEKLNWTIPVTLPKLKATTITK